MATIREVAARAGVAPITVSRVLNNTGYVTPETRARVESVIAELHYIPNKLGQSLKFRKTNTLALVVSDITNPFWTTVTRGVEDAASEHNYSVVLCNTDESQTKQDKYVRLLLERQTDGFLLVPTHPGTETVKAIQRQNVPLVLLDRQVPHTQVDIVRADSLSGARELVEYLIALGHRRITILSGPEENFTSIKRLEGYKQALLTAGIEPDPALIHFGEYNQGSGFKMMQEVLSMPTLPTAIFATNNFIAIGVLQALRQANIAVPDMISVVGFDDLPITLLIEPFLTVAAQPAYDMGYRAAKLLLAHMSGEYKGETQEIVLPTELVIRRSARPAVARNL